MQPLNLNKLMKLQVECHEPITTNVYLKEPLRAIGNYKDYVDFESGKLVKQLIERIFDGTEGWYKNGEKDGLVRYFVANVVKLSTPTGCKTTISNMFPYTTQGWNSSWYEQNTIQSHSVGWFGVCVSIEDFPTVDAFKSFLATQKSNGTPFKAYVLATPIEETIDLSNLPTFKGTTIYTVGTTVQPSNMEVTYYSTEKE